MRVISRLVPRVRPSYIPLFQPSRNHNTLPCQIPGLTQHRRDVRHFLRNAQPSDRNISHIAGRPLHGLRVGDHPRLADHRGRDIIHCDAILRQLQRQVLAHAAQPSLARCIVAAVDPAAVGRDAGHEDDATPFLGDHVRDGDFTEDEGRAEVDCEGVVPFVQGNVHNLGDAFAMAGVGDKDIWAVAVILFYLLEERGYVVCGGHVDLVGGELLGGIRRRGFEGPYQLVDGAFVLRVGEGEVTTILI